MRIYERLFKEDFEEGFKRFEFNPKDNIKTIAENFAKLEPKYDMSIWNTPKYFIKDGKWKLLHYIKMYNETGNLSYMRNKEYDELTYNRRKLITDLSKEYLGDPDKIKDYFDSLRDSNKRKEIRDLLDEVDEKLKAISKKYFDVPTKEDLKKYKNDYIELFKSYSEIFKQKGLNLH